MGRQFSFSGKSGLNNVMSVSFTFIYLLCVMMCLLCGLIAAASDIRGMRIANTLSLIIIVSFIPPAYLSWSGLAPGLAMPNGPVMHFISFLSVFLLTLILFALGILGAGDSKLTSAYGLWLGFEGLMPFIFAMALTGFVIGLLALFIKRFRIFADAPSNSWPGQLHAGYNAVPYGVAIFVGAITGFFSTGYISLNSSVDIM